MRAIKFRFWNEKHQEMIGWDDVASSKVGMMIGGNDGKKSDWRIEVMQFTGLLDKNGKEIYEGDIVRTYVFDTTPMPLEFITPISFHEGTFTVIKMNEEPLSLRDAILVANRTKQGLEIIGNIYEDSELLK